MAGRDDEFLCNGAQCGRIEAFYVREIVAKEQNENGGAKVGHGSGGMSLLRAA